jgi:hypothetical protein
VHELPPGGFATMVPDLSKTVENEAKKSHAEKARA